MQHQPFLDAFCRIYILLFVLLLHNTNNFHSPLIEIPSHWEVTLNELGPFKVYWVRSLDYASFSRELSKGKEGQGRQ